MTSVLPVLLLAGCVFLAGCDGEGRRDAATDVIDPEDKNAAGSWLRATDHTDPAVWLAGREQGHALAETDPAVADMRQALASARVHFLETERMLANRSAQVGRMLADDGHPEGYAALLRALSGVAAVASTRQTYGEICQHYFNLRRRGVSREEALKLLSERYQSQRQFR
jgi:hypothetical protein